MKKVLMFHLSTCPYCHAALAWIKELKEEHPELQKVDIQMIEELEQPEIAEQYDYYYVPTLYVDGVKVHEGAATKEKMHEALKKAL